MSYINSFDLTNQEITQEVNLIKSKLLTKDHKFHPQVLTDYCLEMAKLEKTIEAKMAGSKWNLQQDPEVKKLEIMFKTYDILATTYATYLPKPSLMSIFQDSTKQPTKQFIMNKWEQARRTWKSQRNGLTKGTHSKSVINTMTLLTKDASMFKKFGVSQYNIKRKIRKYLEVNNRDADFIEKFNKGYCNSIATLWAFTKWLQTQAETGNVRDDYTWFKSTVESIVGWNETRGSLEAPNGGPSLLAQNFEQFIAKIEYFQYAFDYMSVGQGDLNKKVNKQSLAKLTEANTVKVKDGSDESILSYYVINKNKTEANKVKNIKQEYSIAALFTLKQLKQLLNTSGIIQEHKLALIMSGSHMTALFKDGDNYYYFDPNYPAGEIKALSSDKIAELIFMANGFSESLPSPLGFRMFCFDKKSAYPDVDVVLSAIKPESKPTKGYAKESSGLQIAAKNNSLDSVAYYLTADKQIDVNEKTDNGWTALMLAASEGYLEVVQALIAAHANLEEKKKDDQTVLMLAANKGYLEIVQVLIAAHANLEEKNKNGNWTALMIAAEKGHLEVVQALIAAHANLEEKDTNGWSALAHAVSEGYLEIVQVLIAANANLEKNIALIIAAMRGYPEIVQVLVQAGASIDITANKYAMIALMYAAENNHHETVKKLIELGANINEKETNNGYTALMIATEKGNIEAAQELIAAHVAEHTGFEEKGTDDCTALMIAVLHDNITIATKLIEAGASLDTKDNNNKTALMWAIQRGNQEMIKLLAPKIESIPDKKTLYKQ